MVKGRKIAWVSGLGLAILGFLIVRAQTSISTPVITPSSGTTTTAFSVTVSCSTTGAEIHYTLNGATPTLSDSIVASGGTILIGQTCTMKAAAYLAGSWSNVASQTYQITGSVAAGDSHTIVLRTDGTVYGFGSLANGRIGNGPSSGNQTTKAQTRTATGFLTNIVGVSAASSNSVAWDVSGGGWSWGVNTSGQLSDGTTTQRTNAVAMLSTNSVTLTEVNQLAAGTAHTLILRQGATQNGSVWAVGQQQNGRLGNGNGKTAVASILYPVKVVDISTNSITNIVEVAAGDAYSLALDNQGRVLSWGYNNNGQLGNGSATTTQQPYAAYVYQTNGVLLTNVITIASGANHGLAVKWNSAEPGVVYAWGQQQYGRLGNNLTAALAHVYPVRVLDNNTNLLTNIVEVAGGDSHTLALDATGKVYAWGLGTSGQLGNGATTPTGGVGLANLMKWNGNLITNAVEIAAAGNHSQIVLSDGTVLGFGVNSNGQLGNGTTSTTQTAGVLATGVQLTDSPPTTTVSFSGTPFNGTSTVTINSSAADSDGTIAKVEFYSGTNLIGTSTTSPYSFTWNNVSPGTYQIKAVAYDNLNVSTTSSPATLTVNAMPTVSLTSPTAGSSFYTTDTIALAATASDSDGTISQVSFYSDGTLLGTATSAPYTYSWTTATAGTHSLTAKATDNSGAVTTSSAVSITVVANTKPSVTLAVTNNPNGTSYYIGAPVTLTATPTDPDSGDHVAKVEFFDGGTSLGFKTASPWTWTWTPSTTGTHSLTAKATDSRNAVSNASNTITATVSTNSLPSVSITSPTAGSTVTTIPVSISANASDSDGSIGKVEFYADSTLIATDTTSPYQVSWSNPTSGAHTLTAIAYDNRSAPTTSAGVAITVNYPPTAQNLNPSTLEDTNLGIALSGSDPEGATLTYTVVTNPAHGTLSGTAPNLTYTPSANYNGSDSFTYKVSDGLSFSNVATVSITITPVNDPPVAQNQSVSALEGSSTPITLVATDIDSPSLTYSIVTQPAHGTLSGTLPNLVYIPNQYYGGSDSFTFKANDGQADSNVATVSINVTFTDSNGNGLPDDWEYNYFGDLNQAAIGDFDGDQISNLQEWQQGTNPADYYNGATPTITKISGDNQVANHNTFAAQPLLVQVSNSQGTVLNNAPVTFTIGSGGGQLALTNSGAPQLFTTLTVRTNTSGQAQVYYQEPSAINVTSLVGVSAGTAGTSFTENSVQILAATPAFNPPAGSYPSQRPITITSSTPNATIYYTTDGSMPTTSSASMASGGAILITSNQTLNAIATAANFDASAMQSSAYQLIGSLSGGLFHTLALKSDGTVWSWGDNTWGELGNIGGQQNAPVSVSGLNHVIAIAGAYSHSLALKDDGTVWGWGYNGEGELGDGSTTNRFSPVQVSSLSNVNAIGGGTFVSLAAKKDGTVWAWGRNVFGGLGDGTTTDRLTPVQVNGLSNIVSVAAGYYQSLALDSSGNVWAWGYNGEGAVGDGTTTQRLTPVAVTGLTNVIAIAAGQRFSVALKNDGTVWAWGYNNEGEVGNGTTTNQLTPVQVSGLTGIIAISAGHYHTLALKNDGTVWGWGINDHGQLGDGTNTNQPVPVQMIGIYRAKAIMGGAVQSGLILGNGTIWTTGYNGFGDLGIGNTIDQSIPVQVNGLDLIEAVPTIAISSPGNNATAVIGQTQTLTATATDTDGSVTEVDFYVNGSWVGQSTSAPFTCSWVPTASGDFTVTALAFDDYRATSFYSTITLHVPVDSNTNGLPDIWEWQNFGQVGVDPNADPDGDGLTNLQEYQQGTNPNDYYNGNTPDIEIISGDMQAGYLNAFAPQPLIVQVKDGITGTSYVNAPVTFSVTTGTSQLAQTTSGAPTITTPITVRTDANGYAQIYVYGGATAGDSTISAQSQNFYPGVAFAYNASALPPPTNVTVQDNGSGQNQITWQDNSSNEDGFTIYRSDDGGVTWNSIGSVAANTTSFTDTTGTAGSSSIYNLTSTSGSASSSASNAAGKGDSDGDNVPDSLDAYPHDRNRSQDIPTISYAVIDISGTTATSNVTSIALDDNEQTAYCYYAGSNAYGFTKVMKWSNGTTSSGAKVPLVIQQTGPAGEPEALFFKVSNVATSGDAYGSAALWNSYISISQYNNLYYPEGPTFNNGRGLYCSASGAPVQQDFPAPFDQGWPIRLDYNGGLSPITDVKGSTYGGDHVGAQITSTTAVTDSLGHSSYPVFPTAIDGYIRSANGTHVFSPYCYNVPGNGLPSPMVAGSYSFQYGPSTISFTVPSNVTIHQESFVPFYVNESGSAIGIGMDAGYPRKLWNGSSLINLNAGFPTGINNQNQAILVDYDQNGSSVGYFWDNNIKNFQDFVPSPYQNQVKSFYPWLISNQVLNSDGSKTTLVACVANNLEGPDQGSWVSRDFILNRNEKTVITNGVSTTIFTNSISKIQLPDGVTTTSMNVLNSSGAIAAIGNPGTNGAGNHAMLLAPIELKQLNYPTSITVTDMGGVREQIIRQNEVAYIRGDPEMPKLQVQIGGGSLSGMSVEWSMDIKSERPERGTKDNYHLPQTDESTVIELPINQAWNISDYFILPADFVGGICTINYQIKNGAGAYISSLQTFKFKIRGKNPIDAVAKNYIQSTEGQFRFAWAMVQHESRQTVNNIDRIYNQFNAGTSTKELPNFSGNYPAEDGWGIAQLDRPLGISASTDEVYGWKNNINKFYAELLEKQNIQQAFFNAVAAAYPNDQEAHSPPSNFVCQGTVTAMTALEAGIVTLYNGAGGCPTSTYGGIAYHNPWTFDPSQPSGQKWHYHSNVNNYLYTVIYNEFEGHLGAQE